MRRLATLLLTAAMLGMAPAHAQGNYPDRPVRLIVAFAPGGAPDIMARAYAEKLKEQLGQPVVVENRPGATGAIGADAVAKAPADGYTLLLNSSAMVINPWVVKQPFDFQKDLVPVLRTAQTPYVLTVSAKLPVQSLDELVAYAKKHPGKLSCATYGVASPPHLALELFKAAAGLHIVHVPYRTFTQALPDLASGQLGCSIDPPTVPAAHVTKGTIRALAHTGEGVMEAFPGAEPFGKRFPSATVVGWQAVFAPAGTPAPVLRRLRTEWTKAITSPEVQQKIRSAGFLPGGDASVEAFTRSIAADHEKFGRIIRDQNIRLE